MTRRAGEQAGTRQNGRRALLASLFAIPLAVISGAQALSSTTLRRAPETALAVFPWNGLAIQDAAYGRLAATAAASAVRTGSSEPAPGSLPRTADLARPAGAFVDPARAAIRREPLAARAFVMMALAESDTARRGRILHAAARLTRRDQTLQALLIEDYGRAGDYPRMIDALDAILRVHPEWRDVVFPALAKTLADEPAAVPTFARLLARPLPWREGFLDAAVGAPGAPDNLALVRERIALDDREFDRKLIARLATDGRIDAAEQLYAKIAGPQQGATGPGQAWRADYPPFDWQLADQPGFRAQSGERPGTLEVAVSPGNGGIVATRLLRNPGAPFRLSLTSTVEPQAAIGDLRLRVACGGEAELFYDRPFTPGTSVFSVEQLPACPFLTLAITARAWTGKPPLQATISPMELSVPSREAVPR